MPRYSAEELVRLLRDIEIKNGKGKSIADCCRDEEISEAAEGLGERK